MYNISINYTRSHEPFVHQWCVHCVASVVLIEAFLPYQHWQLIKIGISWDQTHIPYRNNYYHATFELGVQKSSLAYYFNPNWPKITNTNITFAQYLLLFFIKFFSRMLGAYYEVKLFISTSLNTFTHLVDTFYKQFYNSQGKIFISQDINNTIRSKSILYTVISNPMAKGYKFMTAGGATSSKAWPCMQG